MSGVPYDRFTTDNGGEVEIIDLSQPYGYKDVYWVRLEVAVTFPSGGGTGYRRILEKMGVRGEDLDATRAGLVAAFMETVLPYLSRPDFAGKLKIAGEKKTAPATGYGKQP